MATLRNRPRIMHAGDLSPMARGGDSQFVVDTEHPHLENCTGLFLFDEFQSASLKNYMGGAPAVISGNSWDSQRAISTDGSSQKIVIPDHIRPTAFPFALRVIANHKAGQYSDSLTIGQTSTTSTYFKVGIEGSNSAVCIYQQDTPSSKKNYAVGPANLVDKQEYDMVAVFRAGGKAHLFVNGINVVNATSYTLSFNTMNTFNYGLLERSTDFWYPSYTTKLIQVFDHDPTANIFAMAHDRYAFIKRPKNNRFFYTAAPPAGGFFARRYYDSFIGGKS